MNGPLDMTRFPRSAAWTTSSVRICAGSSVGLFTKFLSQPDPWHILPVVMLATSFLVQFYTPSPGVDPAQQRMMAFMMPLFSFWWTWSYAAGLALYWNIGNFIMAGQQLVMNRTALGKEMREIQLKRAEAKAKAKAAAGGGGQDLRSKIAAARKSGAKTIEGRR